MRKDFLLQRLDLLVLYSALRYIGLGYILCLAGMVVPLLNPDFASEIMYGRELFLQKYFFCPTGFTQLKSIPCERPILLPYTAFYLG
jgi:hypothetical protein